MDSDRDNPINTFVRTEDKEILIKDKDKWQPFEVRGIDMGSVGLALFTFLAVSNLFLI